MRRKKKIPRLHPKTKGLIEKSIEILKTTKFGGGPARDATHTALHAEQKWNGPFLLEEPGADALAKDLLRQDRKEREAKSRTDASESSSEYSTDATGHQKGHENSARGGKRLT